MHHFGQAGSQCRGTGMTRKGATWMTQLELQGWTSADYLLIAMFVTIMQEIYHR
ncbi:hypothetical protein [Wolbachia endosymbiont of Ctenocephalides felis wCfeJ]|uniref:hypothetical protein n=1 Tax=Wolbachia endosymbiont of Ctenocephalides felis wCfeJ TaxID=2732594 RepID=UPI001447EF5D|nr:hypothetical protein [Wolbachia endosymbiont of Ctenocephalides felis wCfeJ]